MRFHLVSGRKPRRALDASSKLNAGWAFPTHLFRIGREAVAAWLAASFDDLGASSTVDVDALLSGAAPGTAARGRD